MSALREEYFRALWAYPFQCTAKTLHGLHAPVFVLVGLVGLCRGEVALTKKCGSYGQTKLSRISAINKSKSLHPFAALALLVYSSVHSEILNGLVNTAKSRAMPKIESWRQVGILDFEPFLYSNCTYTLI